MISGLLPSCTREDAVLATSKIGNISRSEFYTWLGAKKIEKESILGDRKKQKLLLESMGLEMFIMDRAAAEEFDKRKDISILKEQMKEPVLYNYFNQTLTEMATYSEPAIRVSYILLPLDLYRPDPDNKERRIRLEPQEVARKNEELLSRAKEIIKKLDEGESFENMAASYSEDSTKKRGGDYGYMFKDMMPAYFSESAFKLEKGEYTKTPCMTPKGVYIIKVTDRTILTEKNIDKILVDKKQCDRMKSLLVRRYKNEYIERLENADDVAFYDNPEKINNTDTIFRVGAKEYILADIDKIIDSRLTRDNLKKMNDSSVMSDENKLIFAKEYFKYLIWTREAVRLGVDKLPEYRKELKEKEINIIMGEYINTQLLKDVFVSDQEIMEKYEKDMASKYSDKVLENGVVVNKPLPLDVVRDEIVTELKEKTLREKGLQYRKRLMEQYDFEINETALQEA